MPEKRRFIRLDSSLIARIRGRSPNAQDAPTQESTITNISMGGVFIETATPFESGTLVELDFSLPRSAERVHARGVVRWSGRDRNGPMGMGIEFLEVTYPARDSLKGYLDRRTPPTEIAELVSGRLKRDLLRLYADRIDRALSLEEVGRALRAGHEEIIESLAPFVLAGLIRTTRDQVEFLSRPADRFQDLIDEWLAANPPEDDPPA